MCVWSFCVCKTASYFYTLQCPQFCLLMCIWGSRFAAESFILSRRCCLCFVWYFFSSLFFIFYNRFFLLHACDYVYLNAKFIQKYKKTNRSIATCPVSVNWWINAGYFFLVALLYSIEKRKRRNISIAKTVQWKFNQRVLNVNANHPH